VGLSLDCITIGDSIATYQGLGGALHCQVLAVKGMSSSRIVQEAEQSSPHEVCIISAGSNDPLNINLRNNLEAIRKNVNCKIVVWVKPANHRASAIVEAVAQEHNDKTVQVVPGRDHVHPRNYKKLGKQILGELNV